MGGYGTMKFALTQGRLFSKASPLSSVFQAQGLMELDYPDFAPKAITGKIQLSRVLNSIHII